MSRVGERIRDERNKAGMTAKELAKKLGLAESFVSDVEQGRKIVNETIIRKIEKLFNTSLNESGFDETEVVVASPVENIKEVPLQKSVNKQWEDAFSNLMRKIPVCDMSLKEIHDYKYLPVLDKKVDGFTADKVMFVKVEDDSMRGFRLHRNDVVMIYQSTEFTGNSLLLIKDGVKNAIRQVKRLDANKALVISHGSELKTETWDIKSLTILGRCIKAEFEL